MKIYLMVNNITPMTFFVNNKQIILLRIKKLSHNMINYIYPIQDQNHLNTYRNYKDISDNPEDRNLCIYRERWQEIEHFSKTNNCLFFSNGKYTTPNFIETTPNGTSIPRMGIREYESFLKAGQPSIITWDQYKQICHWYQYVPESLTKRKIVYTTSEDLEQNFEKYLNLIKDSKNRFFVKSSQKHWSYAGSYEGWIDSGAAYSISMGNSKELCMLSEYVDIKTDDCPALYIEYRCYFILGKLRSISRYVDYAEHTIPTPVYDFASQLESEVVGKYLPHTVVLDIMDTNRGLLLLEANDMCCSGRYLNNKLESFPLNE